MSLGESIGFEFARRMSDKARGCIRFSSLMKKKIKGKNYAVFYFAGGIFFFIYEVFTLEFFKKRAANHYSYVCKRLL